MAKKGETNIYGLADYVGLSESERAVFRSVVDSMTSKGLFEPTDVPLIASYSRNVVLARKAAECIEERGVLLDEVDAYRGVKSKENPAIGIMSKAQNAIDQLGSRLGLNPTGRKRMKGEGKAQKSALEKFNEEYKNGED